MYVERELYGHCMDINGALYGTNGAIISIAQQCSYGHRVILYPGTVWNYLCRISANIPGTICLHVVRHCLGAI